MRTRQPGRARPSRIGLGTAVWICQAVYVAGVYASLVVAGSIVAPGTWPAGTAGFGDNRDVALAVVATVLVAVTYEPVAAVSRRLLRRTRRFGAGSPYEVLTAFTGTVAAAPSPGEVLPQLARVVGEGTGARQVAVWLTVDDTVTRQVAAWPAAPHGTPHRSAGRDGEPGRDGTAGGGGWRSVAVRHGGQSLGAISLRFGDRHGTSPVEDRLVSHLAAHAGVVLRNVRLTEELTDRLNDLSVQVAALRSSRRRIVEVQDAQRRRLERDIHDGAQQHLVALAVQLTLARVVLGKDPGQAAELLAALRPALGEARRTLVELGRGIYPPTLAADGLPAALAAQAKVGTTPVSVVARGVRRYPPEIEAAAYFSILEALQNAAKHAGATEVTVTLEAVGDALTFEVHDDGTGFDLAEAGSGSGLSTMADRVDAVGGTVHVASSPAGTTVTGRVPTRLRTVGRSGPPDPEDPDPEPEAAPEDPEQT